LTVNFLTQNAAHACNPQYKFVILNKFVILSTAKDLLFF